MLELLIAVALTLAPASSDDAVFKGRTRVFYIAADELIWDYAPSGINQVTGKPLDEFQSLFVKRGPTQLGSKSKKALFREYTDSTFRTLKPRSADEAHHGFLGPMIRAEVGDSIRVVFRNNGTHPYSVHPHGVIYDKASEGAGYDDNSGAGQRGDDGVAPGTTYTYHWFAGERAGPGPMDGSSALWMYHSHVDESKDVNSGLMGPMVVTARGKAKADGSPKDVDREIVMMFAEVDENLSWFIDDNIRMFAMEPDKVKKAQGPTFTDPFGSLNLRESMNGFIFGNGPMPTMTVGDRVRWYIMSSTNFELHAPHWHGNVVTAMGMKTDVLNLGTMGMIVADMVADNPGTWLFHCHIEPHLVQGMQSRFSVMPAATMAGKARKP
jgi:manganese oxidase